MAVLDRLGRGPQDRAGRDGRVPPPDRRSRAIRPLAERGRSRSDAGQDILGGREDEHGERENVGKTFIGEMTKTIKTSCSSRQIKYLKFVQESDKVSSYFCRN